LVRKPRSVNLKELLPTSRSESHRRAHVAIKKKVTAKKDYPSKQ